MIIRLLILNRFCGIEGKFDFIYLRHVIEHINEPQDFLDYIAEKYLTNDGVEIRNKHKLI